MDTGHTDSRTEGFPPQVAALAALAEVDPEFVLRALDSGALGPRGPEDLTETDEAPLRILLLWDTAGFGVEAIGKAIEQGRLSFSFLEAPSILGPPRIGTTFEEFVDRSSLTEDDVSRLHLALGLDPPSMRESMREGDDDVLTLLATMVAAGADEAAVLRLFRVYADVLRRMGQAEAEFFEAEFENPARLAGADEEELFALGVDVGHQVVPLIEKAMFAIYRRHRQHVWLDHTLGHLEPALESAGLATTQAAPPTVAFVDLTGFTGLTEELGDEAAADMSGRLASLVDNISLRHDGRPVRWLGDGGMFVFRDASSAVAACLEVVVEAPTRGLPPTHIGIHTGPVIFQDGDVYGRSVNLAARLSAHAGPGEILVSDAVVDAAGDKTRFEKVGPVELKGVAAAIQVFRVRKSS